jgi:hypothetical protein
MGIGGRPGHDFQRQNRRKPVRCQPMKVFGVTFVVDGVKPQLFAAAWK